MLLQHNIIPLKLGFSPAIIDIAKARSPRIEHTKPQTNKTLLRTLNSMLQSYEKRATYPSRTCRSNQFMKKTSTLGVWID